MQYPTKPAFTLDDLMRGPIAKAASTPATPASSKKVFYIIRRGGDAIRVRSCIEEFPGTFTNRGVTLSNASRFNSVVDATAAIGRRARSQSCSVAPITISRITETPTGPSTIRLVSTRTIDATKPVVIYYPEDQQYAEQQDGRLYGVPRLQQATVFPSLDEALDAIADNAKDIGRTDAFTFGSSLRHIQQVEVIPGAPTVTETVLA